MALPNLGFPLAAASAAAAEFMLGTGGIHARRGRLAFTAVLSAFLLGALWLASARSIAGAVGHCLAVEGFALDDEECKVSIQWTACLACLSVAFVLAIWYGEKARAAADQAGGGARQRRPDRDQLDIVYFLVLYHCCAVILAVGKMTQRGGARRLLQDPSDEEAAHSFKIGAIYFKAGFLAFSVVHCCFSIPYVLLRLMWFLRDQFLGSKLA